jgi:hypothetical protein
MSEKIYVEGIRAFPKKEKAPEFVIGSGVITPETLKAFCETNSHLMTEYNGAKQLKFQILKRQDGGLSFVVDTWKPA